MNKLTCLVIEDDQFNRKLMKSILNKMKINCIFAHDGIEAVDKFFGNKGEFDLIITDIIMPGMDGIQISNLFKEESNIPIIVCTADITDESKIKLYEIGIDDYLLKPIQVSDLMDSINKIINEYDLEKNKKDNGTNYDLLLKNKLIEIRKNLLNENLKEAERNTFLIKYILLSQKKNIDLIEKLEELISDKALKNSIQMLELIEKELN